MRIFQVDAFTRERFGGNPATVILDSREDDTLMRAIAREFPHAETAFVFAANGAGHDLRVRFFNARKEAAFVGHATLAVHAVMRFLGRHNAHCRQLSGTGVIDIETLDAEPPRFEFRQQAPEWLPVLGEEAVECLLAALGLNRQALHPHMAPQVARKGASRALIAVRERVALDGVRVDREALLRLGKDIDAEGFFLFACEVDGSNAASNVRTFARMFCPAIGIDEDPVSGNAHAMLAAMLWRHGVLNGASPSFVGSQGAHVQRPGQVFVTAQGGSEMSYARIGGHAVIVSEGTLIEE